VRACTPWQYQLVRVREIGADHPDVAIWASTWADRLYAATRLAAAHYAEILGPELTYERVWAMVEADQIESRWTLSTLLLHMPVRDPEEDAKLSARVAEIEGAGRTLPAHDEDAANSEDGSASEDDE
jgi:hypothetical protein